MPTHMTLRLAWHNDGWNGRICEKPERNTYCVGCSSYPGEMIREQRDLRWEKENAGKPISDLDTPPPCMYSASVFSDSATEVYSEPPEFFNDETKTRFWKLPPFTACTWPYEAMYNKPDVKIGNSFDYDKRLKYSEEHFSEIERDKSLVFYYANYSNPVSTDENPVYVLVGVARIKEIAPTIYYDNCSDRTLEKYKGFVWQRGVTSHYPDEGLRLPYHRYLDDPVTLNKFAVIPENSGLCKYATKHVSDDEALGLLESLLESVRIVRDDVQDDSENWQQRIEWLESLIGELWKSRGAFPGMPAVLEVLGLAEAISGFREAVESGKEQQAVDEVRQFVSGGADELLGFYPDDIARVRRKVMLEIDDNEELWLDVLPRCSLSVQQIKSIVGESRDGSGVTASLTEITKNPYLLAEQYVGKESSDQIRWSIVDRGMLPSPDLQASGTFRKDDPERLRALLLETLKGNHQQTFMRADHLLEQVNSRIKAQPEWKQNFVSEKYLKVDREFYKGAIHLRDEDDELYLYDRVRWEDERFIEEVFNQRLVAADIQLKRPVGDEFWRKVLYKSESSLVEKAGARYEEAVRKQQEACSTILNKRFAAITGGAGTGKTTIVSALIKAIRKVEGEGAGVAVLAPTGKATDRLRAGFDDAALRSVNTRTIHSILARYGWLNQNMTFKKSGGKRIQEFGTIIVDECSMIDLTLMAALFRAIDWDCVTRLILVGDAAQLPPIGVGKVYAEIVTYLRGDYPDNLASLTENLRKMESQAEGKGDGILTLASCFINDAVRGSQEESEPQSLERKRLISRLHEGGEVDRDLRIVYWEDAEYLQETVVEEITKDFEELLDVKGEGLEAAEIWKKALDEDINCMQILSPVRGDLFGTESINQKVQGVKSAGFLERKGELDGFTYFDKVIQVVNRPESNPLRGYDHRIRDKVELEIFNGEIGKVVPTGKWGAALRSRGRIKQFSVQFSGKENISVNYGFPADKPEGNLELAYALSVHKAQGSEFNRVYVVLPQGRASAQQMELIYTALTRASQHCTVFVQDSVETLVNAMRPEQSALKLINSSLFNFNPVRPELAAKSGWYEAGKIHEALTGDMVRSKSEVIITNLLHERGVAFWYEKPLLAPDGTLYLPDFTVKHLGEEYYWEHVGMLADPEYEQHWEEKKAWYEKHFPGKLFTTMESSELSRSAQEVIERIKGK